MARYWRDTSSFPRAGSLWVSGDFNYDSGRFESQATERTDGHFSRSLHRRVKPDKHFISASSSRYH